MGNILNTHNTGKSPQICEGGVSGDYRVFTQKRNWTGKGGTRILANMLPGRDDQHLLVMDGQKLQLGQHSPNM
jgi:hypothetical protein